jgi:hypothetical protein
MVSLEVLAFLLAAHWQYFRRQRSLLCSRRSGQEQEDLQSLSLGLASTQWQPRCLQSGLVLQSAQQLKQYPTLKSGVSRRR